MHTDVRLVVKEFFNTYPLKRLQKGEILLRPEEKPTEIFYLEEGTVAQYDISPSGNEVIVNVFKPGAFFPMSHALNDTSNQYYFFETTTAVALRPAPISDVIALLKTNHQVTLDLLKRVYRGSDGLLRRTAHLMGGNAKSRLIFELLNASYRFGAVDRSGSLTIALNESDIAKRSGLSRETVSRNLRDLKAAGIVSVASKGLVISDIDKLESLLGSDL